MVAFARRRSPRLAALESQPEDDDKPKPKKSTKAEKPVKVPKPKRTSDRKKATKKENTDSGQPKKKRSAISEKATKENILPRTREEEVKKESSTSVWVMGIDEAGRGPLAGPVVAAAAVVPAEIQGITDSKKISLESAREELYEAIIASSDVSWAVAVVDAPRIDEINILQATMQAMSMAASALVCDSSEAESKWEQMSKMPACSSRKGCYVACGGKMLKGKNPSNSDTNKKAATSTEKSGDEKPECAYTSYYALVDGNRVPTDLPCEGESIVKGDSKEYSIGAASILAKVTRDRLMHSYDKLYPEYKLAKHKGYPTKEHMAAVFKCGASPIHRRTFAPLKHMTFDENGNIVDEEETN